MAFDSDVLLAQLYNKEDGDSASIRTGTVLAVNTIAGTITVEVAGSTLTDVPYSTGVFPKVGLTVWIIAQGTWFAAISAAASSGQVNGLDEVWVGTEAPVDQEVQLYMDTNDVGVGDGWGALDQRYVQGGGDTMAGPLYAAREPVDPSEFATKSYVDAIAPVAVPHAWGSGASGTTATALTASYAVVNFGGSEEVGGGITVPAANTFRLPKAGRYLVTVRLMPAAIETATQCTVAIGNALGVSQVEFSDLYVPASGGYRHNASFVYSVLGETDMTLLYKSSVARSSNYNTISIDYLGDNTEG